MVERLQYRRRHCYATRSNKVRKVKTPGGRLIFQYAKKRTSAPKCGATGVMLQGISAQRSNTLPHIAKRHKNVSRIYGGHLSHGIVKERIIRAFLIEEQKIVKKVLKLQQAKELKAAAR